MDYSYNSQKKASNQYKEINFSSQNSEILDTPSFQSINISKKNDKIDYSQSKSEVLIYQQQIIMMGAEITRLTNIIKGISSIKEKEQNIITSKMSNIDIKINDNNIPIERNRNYEEKITLLIREIDYWKNQCQKFEKYANYEIKFSDYENKIKVLEKEKNDLKKNLDNKINENNDLNNQIEQFKSDLLQSSSKYSNLQEKNAKLLFENQELFYKIKSFDQFYLEKNSLNLKISENESKISLLLKELEKLSKIINQKDNEIESYKNKLIIFEDKDREITRLQSKIKDYELKNKVLMSEIEEYRSKITELELKLTKYQSEGQKDIEIYENENKKLQNNLNEYKKLMENEINKYKWEIEDLLRTIEDYKLKNEENEKNLMVLVGEIEMLSSKLDSFSEFSKKFENLQQEKNKLESIINSKNSEIEDLLLKIKKYINEINSLKSENENNINEIQNLKQKISDFDQKNHDLEQKILILMQDKKNLQEKIDLNNRLIEKLEKEKSDFSNKQFEIDSKYLEIKRLNELLSIENSKNHDLNTKLSDRDYKLNIIVAETDRLVNLIRQKDEEINNLNDKIKNFIIEIDNLNKIIKEKDKILLKEKENLALIQDFKEKEAKFKSLEALWAKDKQNLLNALEELKKLKEEINRLEDELRKEKNLNENDFKWKIDSLTNENNELNNETVKLKKLISDLTNNKYIIERELEENKKEKERIKIDFEWKIKNIEDNFQKNIFVKENEIKQLNENLREIIEKMNEYEGIILEFPNLEAQINHFQDLYNQSKQENNVLISKTELLESEIKDFEQNKKSLQSEIDRLKLLLEKEKKITLETELKLKNLKLENQELLNKLKLLTQEFDNQKKINEENLQKITKFQNSNKELIDLESKIVILTREIDSLRVLLEREKNENYRLLQSISDLESLKITNKNLQQELNNLKTELYELLSENEELTEKYNKLTIQFEDISSYDKKLKDYENSNINFKREIDHLNLLIIQRNEEIDRWRSQCSKLEKHINEIRLKETLLNDLENKIIYLTQENERIKNLNEQKIVFVEQKNNSNIEIIENNELNKLKNDFLLLKNELKIEKEKNYNLLLQLEEYKNLINFKEKEFEQIKKNLEIKIKELEQFYYNEANLQEKLIIQNVEIDRKNQEIDLKENRILLLDQRNKNLDEEINEWRMRYEDIQKYFEGKNINNEKYTNEIFKLNQNIQENQIKYQKLEEDYKEKCEEKIKYSENIKVYEEKIAILSAEIMRLTYILKKDDK